MPSLIKYPVALISRVSNLTFKVFTVKITNLAVNLMHFLSSFISCFDILETMQRNETKSSKEVKRHRTIAGKKIARVASMAASVAVVDVVDEDSVVVVVVTEEAAVDLVDVAVVIAVALEVVAAAVIEVVAAVVVAVDSRSSVNANRLAASKMAIAAEVVAVAAASVVDEERRVAVGVDSVLIKVSTRQHLLKTRKSRSMIR